MSEPPLVEKLIIFLPALVGGCLDYLRQVQMGERRWLLWAFVMHLSMAVFIGWVCGAVAAGLGYNADVSMGVAGFGGFLGVRVADLIYLIIGKKAGV